MMERPNIGILLDYEGGGSFSKRPHYALRTIYFDAFGTLVAPPLVSRI